MNSILNLIRNWTLPVAMTLGIGGYLLFRYLPILDPVAECYAPLSSYVLPILMFLVLFVVFCKTDFHQLRLKRWHLYVAMLQTLLVALFMAPMLVWPLSVSWFILLEALLAIVICPCAAAAPVVTMKLGGNLEQMTSYTFLSNLVSALLIPLCFPLLPGACERSAEMAFLPLFIGILWKVMAVLLLPMIAAWITKKFLPRFHGWVISIKDLSYYMWAFTLMLVSGTTARNIAEAWQRTPLILLLAIAFFALLVCLLQYGLGRLVGGRFGRPIEAGQGMGQKNTAFAIWTTTAFLTPLSSVGPGCYILWQNTINSLEIYHYSSAKEKANQKA